MELLAFGGASALLQRHLNYTGIEPVVIVHPSWCKMLGQEPNLAPNNPVTNKINTKDIVLFPSVPVTILSFKIFTFVVSWTWWPQHLRISQCHPLSSLLVPTMSTIVFVSILTMSLWLGKAVGVGAAWYAALDKSTWVQQSKLWVRAVGVVNINKMVFTLPIATISCNTCPMVVSSGFYQSPEPPQSGNVRGNLPAHCHGQQNGQQSRCMFTWLFCLLLPWRPLGQYRASICPMVASRGFRDSPGHAALSDMSSLAPTCLHGHWNGQQRRYICSSLSILSSTITVPKHHSNT